MPTDDFKQPKQSEDPQPALQQQPKIALQQEPPPAVEQKPVAPLAMSLLVPGGRPLEIRPTSSDVPQDALSMRTTATGAASFATGLCEIFIAKMTPLN